MDRYEFIWKAIQKHGYKYDYRKVKYKNAKTKVCITCPEHGEFWQTPDKHLRGSGCSKCAGVHKPTTEEWIEKAKKIHGDKYNYSKVEYIDTTTDICIICPVHGEFWQTPYNHLKGNGCLKCSGKHNYTTEEWIEKAKEVHGNKYDYSKVNYKNNHTKICIICPIHGEFWQTPQAHLTGRGCLRCKKSFKLTTETFIEKAIKVHGDKYDYSKVDYINSDTKVCIICPIHGEFWQRPNNHLLGHGCFSCEGSQQSSTEEFIEKAKAIHGDKYDYSKVEYKNCDTKVCIICHEKYKNGNEHGEFWQTPYCHLVGKGCSKCKKNKLEEEITIFLNENDIKNERQKGFEWLKNKLPLKLDFYLPEYNVAIECQGEQHYRPVKHFGGEKSFADTIKRDKIKYDKCKEHNIKILYYTNIKNLVQNCLTPLFDDKNELLKEIKNI